MFDLLVNADFIVDDVGDAGRLLQDALGFPEQKPHWSNLLPGLGFTYQFARVHPSMAVSPTRVEIVAVAELSDERPDPGYPLPFLQTYLDAQSPKPFRTHGTEIGTSSMADVLARLDGNGVEHTIAERGDRCLSWIGFAEANAGQYRPDWDAGLLLELVDTDLLVPRADFWTLPTVGPLAPGSMIRVVSRGWLVPDLAEALTVLDMNFDWRPAIAPELDEASGALRVDMPFRHPRSAALQLLEPRRGGLLAEYAEQWGSCPWHIRIGVNDLDAKTKDLSDRGTDFARLTLDDMVGEGVRVMPSASGLPAVFEFVEIDPAVG
jgi:hypothetical protein